MALTALIRPSSSMEADMSQNMVQFRTPVTVPARLAALVTHLTSTLGQITTAEATVKAADREIVVLAMAAGDDLRVIKDDVGFGNFGSWLEANVACTQRTANKYMKLAAGRAVIEAEIGTGSDLSITAALKLLRPKKPADDPDLEGVA